MRRLVLSALIAGIARVAVHADECFPAGDCGFTYYGEQNVYSYSVRGLCRGDDYTVHDSMGEPIYFQICGAMRMPYDECV